MLLSLWMLVRALKGTAPHLTDQAAQDWRFAISRERMLGGFAMLAAYLLIVPLVGFFTTSLIFVMLVAWVAGYRHIRNLLLTSVGFCLFVYLIFVALFDRPPAQRADFDALVIRSIRTRYGHPLCNFSRPSGRSRVGKHPSYGGGHARGYDRRLSPRADGDHGDCRSDPADLLNVTTCRPRDYGGHL